MAFSATYVLVEDKIAVERVEYDVGSAAEHDFACYVVYSCAFYWSCEGEFPGEFEAVEVPEQGDSILRDGDECAECFGYGDVGDWCFVAEERGAWVQLNWFPYCRVNGVDRYDTVLACSDERFGIGKDQGRDLPNVKVLKDTGRLERVSDTTTNSR